MRKQINVTSGAGVGWCGPLLSPQLHCALVVAVVADVVVVVVGRSGPATSWGHLHVAQLH